MAEQSPDSPADVNRFAAAIRQIESGGNYQAIGPPTRYGRATGAYQFLDSTWNGYGGYRRAADAPPPVQDAAARALMSQYFGQFGSWRAVAVAWHAGPGVAARYAAGTFDIGGIGDVNISTQTYVNRVMAAFGDGSEGSTPGGVKAPETSALDRLTGLFGELTWWKRLGMGALGMALIWFGWGLILKDILQSNTKTVRNVVKRVADAGA